MVFKQHVATQIGVDLAPFWATLFIFPSKYIKQLISNESPKGQKCHEVSRFTDDLCAINDGKRFPTLFKNVYPKELKHSETRKPCLICGS